MLDTPTLANRKPSWWEWLGLAVLLLFFIGLGFATHYRSTRAKGRMTDLGVYTRAAWAVREGLNPYDTPEEHGWHYLYPPPFVLLMLPLADPPADRNPAGFVPFSVSVLVWYALNVGFLIATVHLFANSVCPGAKPWSRRWLYLRIIPLDLALPALSYTLSRGQVNVLVLLLLALTGFSLVRRRSMWAGIWLALATVIKVLPGLIVFWPLVQRQWKWLGSLASSALVFLLVVPACVWGVAGAIDMNRNFLTRIAGPVLTNHGDDTIHKEFSGTTSTDSQAFHAVIHAWSYPNRFARPDVSTGFSKSVHYAIGIGLLAVLVAILLRRPVQPDDPIRGLLVLGGFCIIMVHVAPASHMHYYAYSLPMLVAIVAEHLHRHPTRAVPTRTVLLGLLGWTLLTGLPLFDDVPQCVILREFGIAVVANIVLLGWGLVRLWHAPQAVADDAAGRV